MRITRRRLLIASLCTLTLTTLAPRVRADEATPTTKPATRPTGGQVRVACVGDSITYGAGIRDRQKNSYPAQLQNLLGDGYEVRNFGVSGATLLKAGDRPYWKQKAFQEAKDFRPDVVIIKLGTNDSKPQNWAHKETFPADAKALVDEFASLPGKPRVYVCRPVPAFPEAFGIRDSVIKGEVIPLLDAAARETGASVIDLYAALGGKPEMVPDKIHPNAEGAKVIAEAVHKAVAATATKG